jgi:branched-chain amino acid transport system ATP-binding protein
MASPRVLLLDEPSLGLAPLMVGRIGEVISEINRQGTTVLLVEQNATMALRVASHAFVLTTGLVSLSGSTADLRADDAVRDLYLGRGSSPASGDELVSTAVSAAHLAKWSP